jgi:site-specific DNA-methyltransferase (adenine-specific)
MGLQIRGGRLWTDFRGLIKIVHKAEITFRLKLKTTSAIELARADFSSVSESDVVFLQFPLSWTEGQIRRCEDFVHSKTYRFCQFASLVSEKMKDGATLALLGNVEMLPYLHEFLDPSLKFQDWIAVRLSHPRYDRVLPNEHVGLTLYTKNRNVLRHAKVRIAYEYCPFCDKTTKDYGGKKHLYHEYGTLMSDVWKDIKISPNERLAEDVVARIRDMFSIEPNEEMLAVSVPFSRELDTLPLHTLDVQQAFPTIQLVDKVKGDKPNTIDPETSRLYNADAIETLKRIPDETIDLAFADPPYNLSKKYRGYKDNMEIDQYFKWCDLWLEHLVRVLKPGGSLVVVNIPLWSIRYFLYLQQRLTFQNWIVWESLSMPVRFIMPSHYTVLFYTKGRKPNTFNYAPLHEKDTLRLTDFEDKFLYPQADKYCLRSSCIRKRRLAGYNPKKELTDLWTDIYRIKHNSKRADHPCQLPQKLMKRIIMLLTKPGDIVLDCFNGVGTTSLSAHQLGRRYIGVELSPIYHKVALERHRMIRKGLDPFAKRKRIPLDKNSPVPRVRKIRYEVPKKTLQLHIKRMAEKLGHIPSRDEVARFSKYPIEYFDKYFRNWSEVTAAARTTGMSETRPVPKESKLKQVTLLDLKPKNE